MAVCAIPRVRWMAEGIIDLIERSNPRETMFSKQDVPEEFGRYRLLSRLGVGGMGTVFLALDTQLDRQVALKIPHLDPDADHVLVERFRREATLAARISHPHLCPVHDVGMFAGYHYFTMPYIEGTPLSNMLGPKRLWSPRDAALLIRQVALAVAELHANGIIHRDLKPANIIVRPSGEPMLMDFGLALSLAATRLTVKGEPIGTPAYMAPEQVRGDATLGPATDVYSLGVILYELVAGQPPFTGAVLGIFAQILHAAPPAPSALRSDLGLDFDFLCVQAMAKQADRRFKSANDLATALEQYISRTPLPAVANTAIQHPNKTLVAASDRTTVQSDALPPLTEVVHHRCAQCGQMLLVVTDQRDENTPCPRCRDFHQTLPTSMTADLQPTRRMDIPPSPPRRWIIALIVAVLVAPLIYLMLIRPSPSEERTQRTNSLGMTLRLLRGGKTVRDFWMAETEVTNRHFREFAKASKYKTTAETDSPKLTWNHNDVSTEEDQPVVLISWHDAQAFCQWLSEKEKEHYALPTEAEWEHACQAGTMKAYSFGDDEKQLHEYAWFSLKRPERKPNKLAGPGKVGTRKPNPWGLFDLHGNVWEWCEGEVEIESQRFHVLRGGSYNSPAADCRMGSRNFQRADTCFVEIGFRVVVRPE